VPRGPGPGDRVVDPSRPPPPRGLFRRRARSPPPPHPNPPPQPPHPGRRPTDGTRHGQVMVRIVVAVCPVALEREPADRPGLTPPHRSRGEGGGGGRDPCGGGPVGNPRTDANINRESQEQDICTAQNQSETRLADRENKMGGSPGFPKQQLERKLNRRTR